MPSLLIRCQPWDTLPSLYVTRYVLRLACIACCARWCTASPVLDEAIIPPIAFPACPGCGGSLWVRRVWDLRSTAWTQGWRRGDGMAAAPMEMPA